MTGERFRLAQVGFQDGPYQALHTGPGTQDFVPVRAVVLTGGGGAFPADPLTPYVRKATFDRNPLALLTPWKSFLFVVSICDSPTEQRMFRLHCATGVNPGATLTNLQCGGGSALLTMTRTAGFMGATWNYTPTAGLTNFMFYVNSDDQTVQCAVGDTVLTPASEVWTGSGQFRNDSAGGVDRWWFQTAVGGAPGQNRTVRFWATEIVGAIDLNDTLTRRPFVAADDIPNDLPDDGTVAGYGLPTEYCHARLVADDYANPGLHEWTVVNGPLSFDLAACFLP